MAVLFLPCLAPGSEHSWRWVKAGNNAVTGWEIATGNAGVVTKGGKFTAALFWNGSDTDVQITLQRIIAGNKLTVQKTVQSSDYSGSTYTGRRTVAKWPKFSGTTGVETITLSHVLGMIGISGNLTN